MSSSAAWISSAPIASNPTAQGAGSANVRSSGLVTGGRPGNVEITATYQDQAVTVRMTVEREAPPPPTTVGTPWSELPPLSDEARRFITDYNLNYQPCPPSTCEPSPGTVKRWNSFPISIYASPEFQAQQLVEAVDFWRAATGGKITFQIVDSPSTASIVLDMQWPPPDANYEIPSWSCGVEGPARIQNSIIVTGSGHYAFKAKSDCAGNGDHRTGLAHGIGHILGLGGHTASGSDLMGSPGSTWNGSTLLSEIINWLYSVPSGTRPI